MCGTTGPPVSRYRPAAWSVLLTGSQGRASAPAICGTSSGVLQADGYAGFDKLYNEADPDHPIKEAACWAHVRRKFYDIRVATDSPVASEALARIGELYAIETEIRGQPAAARQQVRQARAGPKLEELETDRLIATIRQLSKKSDLTSRPTTALCALDGTDPVSRRRPDRDR